MHLPQLVSLEVVESQLVDFSPLASFFQLDRGEQVVDQEEEAAQNHQSAALMIGFRPSLDSWTHQFLFRCRVVSG